jgi:hypothetical protein
MMDAGDQKKTFYNSLRLALFLKIKIVQDTCLLSIEKNLVKIEGSKIFMQEILVAE